MLFRSLEPPEPKATPHERLALEVLSRSYKDIEEAARWLKVSLPKRIRKWERATGKAKRDNRELLLLDLERIAMKAASAKEYFSTPGGLFEMTLAACGYDPEPFRAHARRVAKTARIDEGLAIGRRWIARLKRERILSASCVLYSGTWE